MSTQYSLLWLKHINRSEVCNAGDEVDIVSVIPLVPSDDSVPGASPRLGTHPSLCHRHQRQAAAAAVGPRPYTLYKCHIGNTLHIPCHSIEVSVASRQLSLPSPYQRPLDATKIPIQPYQLIVIEKLSVNACCFNKSNNFLDPSLRTLLPHFYIKSNSEWFYKIATCI